MDLEVESVDTNDTLKRIEESSNGFFQGLQGESPLLHLILKNSLLPDTDLQVVQGEHGVIVKFLFRDPYQAKRSRGLETELKRRLERAGHRVQGIEFAHRNED